LVLLRLLVLLFPQPEAHALMLSLGIIGVISGELAAWRATEMRRLLAFSSIGQLGAIFIALSIPGEAGLMAALALALHHLLVKPALFLLAERWGGSLAALAGGAKVSPLGAGLFILLSLSIIGVPPLPGFWAKLLALVSLFQQGGALYLLGAAALLFGAALEANYLFRVATAFYHPQVGRPLPPAHRKGELAGAGILGAGLVAAMLLIVPLTDSLEGIAARAADSTLYIGTVMPSTQAVAAGGGQ
jgi:formate hydrogenlyase subunit 3/multisubunit Na+/H+ antiporter MnhD subunit